MKITIYDLMGMIKDAKAPKRIRYNNCFTYTYTDVGYVDENSRDLFFEDFNAVRHLTDEVEIIEDKKIEKIEYYKITDETIEKLIPTLNVLQMDLVNIINEIIDYINEVE